MSTSDSDTIADTPATAEPQENANRKQPFPKGFLDTISTGWAERPDAAPVERAQASSPPRAVAPSRRRSRVGAS